LDSFSLFLDKNNEESYVKMNLKDIKYSRKKKKVSLEVGIAENVEKCFLKVVKPEEKFFKK
jgi:hypothetical protein